MAEVAVSDNNSLSEPIAAVQVVKSANDQLGKEIDWTGPTTAYHRLQYVCGVLWLMETLGGQMPVEYAGLEREVPANDCYRLIKLAMDKETDAEMTYREMWDFVNVLYMNIKQLHDEASPVNAAMAPDPFVLSKVDTPLKQSMKGEIITFLIRTARDFASNTTEDIQSKSYSDQASLLASGFSRDEFNNCTWVLQAFQVAGRNCYKAVGSKYYLYFRAGSQRWVVDDEIVPTGAAYSTSTTSNMNGTWMTSSRWRVAPGVRIIADKSGGFLVTGCTGRPDDQGASSSELENGSYLPRPKSENVNGRTQYVMTSPRLKARGEQRHLIFSNTINAWKITPTCGEEEGSHLSQEGNCVEPTMGRWQVIPADVTDVVRFTVGSMGNARVRRWIPPGDVLGEAQEKRRIKEQEEKREKPQNAGEATSFPMDKEEHYKEEDGYDDAEEEERERHRDDLDQLSDLTPWNSRNHESLVFSNRTSTLAFFSARPDLLKARMNPALIKFLQANNITVGEDLHSAKGEARYHKLLCALTNVQRDAEETSQLLGGRFAITGDALLKFLAIITRIRCGIPVVLLGECGCGKTYTIKFLAAFLDIQLFVLDVHGGTTESDVLDCIARAEACVAETSKEVMVFMDEVNACGHLGLIEECLVQRSVFGRRLDDRLLFLAALNPYREMHIDPNQEMAGLTYRQAMGNQGTIGGNTAPIKATANSLKNKNLVYLVHPVPSALVHVAFDFGALKPKEEQFYIASMCGSTFKDACQTYPNFKDILMNSNLQTVIVEWICTAQNFVRAKERDPSAASLRDAARCLQLIVWFLGIANKRSDMLQKPIKTLINCTIPALAFSYMFRLSSRTMREDFWSSLRTVTPRSMPALVPYKKTGVFEAILSATQRGFCAKFQLEPGIALNEALSENLFVSVVCILNRIPLFLVGKPGTSKTLALQIAASNLLGKSSPMMFWRRFPALAMFTYQCSPLSTAMEIQRQFDMACRFQQHASEQISVFVLDEVGLAEFSPHLPLKVLHSILVQPPVAVVGVSNWSLDRAKMNRAILLTRPEPSVFDLRFTGERISRSFNKSGNQSSTSAVEQEEEGEQQQPKKVDETQPSSTNQSVSENKLQGVESKEEEEEDDSEQEWWLQGLADTFHALYSKEQESGREFWGMRDYYALVRQLKLAKQVDQDTLVVALCRNLGGKPELLESIVRRFVQAIFPRSS